MDPAAPPAPEGAPRHSDGPEPALAEREMFAEALADALAVADMGDTLAEALRARAGLLLGALDAALAAARRGGPREAALEAFVGALAHPAADSAPAEPAPADAPGEEIDLPALRLALQTRIGEIGLRATSREVGISPTAASDLAFKGVHPYRHTRDLLAAWQRGWAKGVFPLGPIARRRALHDLTRHLPPETRAALVERIEDLLDQAAARARSAAAPRGA